MTISRGMPVILACTSLAVLALAGCSLQSATSSASASAARASLSDAGKTLTKSINQFNSAGTATGTTAQQLAESWRTGANVRASRLADVRAALQNWKDVSTPIMSRLPATSDGDTMSQQDVQAIIAAIDTWLVSATKTVELAQSCQGSPSSVVNCARKVSPKAESEMKSANRAIQSSLEAYTGSGTPSIDELLRGSQ